MGTYTERTPFRCPRCGGAATSICMDGVSGGHREAFCHTCGIREDSDDLEGFVRVSPALLHIGLPFSSAIVPVGADLQPNEETAATIAQADWAYAVWWRKGQWFTQPLKGTPPPHPFALPDAPAPSADIPF